MLDRGVELEEDKASVPFISVALGLLRWFFEPLLVFPSKYSFAVLSILLINILYFEY
jgi:hypothetical protein